MAILNETQIKTIFEIDKSGELFNRLLSIFEVDMPKLILDLETALRAEQYTNAKNISHSIKSSSLNIGAAELAMIASQFEETVSVRKSHNMSLIIEFHKCYGYSVTELRGYLNLYKTV